MVSSLIPINEKFQELHEELDVILREARARQSREVLILNAQCISRVGFVIADVHRVRYEVEEAIERRHEEIGTNNSTCLTEAVDLLEEYEATFHETVMDAVKNMHRSIKGIVDTHFYPLMYELEIDSNAMQLRVMNITKLLNVVTDEYLILETLNTEIPYIENFVRTTSQARIEHDFQEITNQMNEMKEEMFKFMKEFFTYFETAAESVKEFVEKCEADDF